MQLLKRLSRLEREWLPEVQRATERLLREQQAPRRDPVPLDYARSWTHPDIRKLYGWHDPWSAAIDRYFQKQESKYRRKREPAEPNISAGLHDGPLTKADRNDQGGTPEVAKVPNPQSEGAPSVATPIVPPQYPTVAWPNNTLVVSGPAYQGTAGSTLMARSRPWERIGPHLYRRRR
jgi:hypothetical protein